MKSDKALKAQARKERLGRLRAIEQREVALADEAAILAGLIHRLPPDARPALRQRLRRIVDLHHLRLPAEVARSKGDMSWAQLETLSISTADPLTLHCAWLSLLAHPLLSREGRLPDGHERIRRAIADEWHRRAAKADGFFLWPRTDAPAGTTQLTDVPSPGQGMFAALGYHVGTVEGLPASVRRFLLDQLFSSDVPWVFSREYTESWHAPGTPLRLRKMAETLASLARMAQRRRTASLDRATEDWLEDLGYLRRAYYAGHFGFAWPRASMESSL